MVLLLVSSFLDLMATQIITLQIDDTDGRSTSFRASKMDVYLQGQVTLRLDHVKEKMDLKMYL